MDSFFIQMADPQFGMFAALGGLDETRIHDLRRQLGWNIRQPPMTTGFADETALYKKAIAVANRLNPAFVVMCGDMVHDEGEAYAQRLQAAGVPTTCSRYDGMIHAFFAMPAVIDKGKQAVSEAAAAMKQAFSAKERAAIR